MALENAIDMTPIKEKLRNLKAYIPDAEEVMCDFAAYLAERINPRVVPMGFVIGAELAIYELENNITKYTSKPSSLFGYSPEMYALMRVAVPQIVDAVCPEEFARGVKEVYDALNAKMREGQ